jgi:hypothetical protein
MDMLVASQHKVPMVGAARNAAAPLRFAIHTMSKLWQTKLLGSFMIPFECSGMQTMSQTNGACKQMVSPGMCYMYAGPILQGVKTHPNSNTMMCFINSPISNDVTHLRWVLQMRS